MKNLLAWHFLFSFSCFLISAKFPLSAEFELSPNLKLLIYISNQGASSFVYGNCKKPKKLKVLITNSPQNIGIGFTVTNISLWYLFRWLMESKTLTLLYARNILKYGSEWDILAWSILSKNLTNPVNIYLFKLNNRSTRKRCEIY